MIQTAIPTTFEVSCQCGRRATIEASTAAIFRMVLCESCGKQFAVSGALYATSLLEALNVKLHLDWDGQLLVDHPADTPRGIINWITRNQCELRRNLQAIARHRQSVFVGGPFNGRRHSIVCTVFGAHYPIRFERRKWAVYVFKQVDDPRLFFEGYATSQRNGKHGILAS